MAAKRKVDYESMLSDWQAGILSPEQMAHDYTATTGVKVTRQAICKHFKGLKIPRDLKARIAFKAEAMVALQEARKVAPEGCREKDISDRDVVEANATNVASRVIAERKDIVKARDIVQGMWTEASRMNDAIPELAAIGQYLKDPAESFDKLNDLYMKIISFPGRVDSIKKLVESLRNLVLLEREVYGIKDSDGGDNKRHEAIQIRLVPSTRRSDDDE